MKRLFLILCLMMICNISYADIASVGYVDSVADTKQDTITDIATIRSGAGLGATAVQPTSLSSVATSGSYNDLSNKPTLATVATSGSYNDLSNKPTIPSLPTGPSDGIYKMVWNGRFKTFMFQKESDLLSCPDGQYDIGFSQCIDVSQKGTACGNINHIGRSNAAADYGLTENDTWGTTLYTGDKVTGIASCNSTPGSTEGETTTEEFSQSSEGQYCWCKMTSPAVSPWVFTSEFSAYSSGSANTNCANNCANRCGIRVRTTEAFRSSVFSSVGN
ncbi:MAG: hypothetical protein MJ170_01170 [Alphaproteobacteria bacterium]|nr:hypothetical protein [Alphaproteobacteria bacterium]